MKVVVIKTLADKIGRKYGANYGWSCYFALIKRKNLVIKTEKGAALPASIARAYLTYYDARRALATEIDKDSRRRATAAPNTKNPKQKGKRRHEKAEK